MKLRSTLVHIAGLVSVTAGVAACVSACSGGPGTLSSDGTNPGTDGGPTNGGKDAGPDAEPVGCGGCNCASPTTDQANVSPAQACALAAEPHGPTCAAFCESLPGNPTSEMYFCAVEAIYQKAYLDTQRDGGAADGGDAGATCPAWSGDVVVQCELPCLGRRTDGIDDPAACDPSEVGAVFANRAYLEAVSVHAFARLERELAFHGAPQALLRAARRAKRDEVRHTTITVRLARRFGATASLPEAPGETPVRSLFEIARENAVEGCVRETYGAVLGLLEAKTSSDREVQVASRRIADDECRHAELASAVARWIEPLLTPSERDAIREAVDEAIAELAERGNRRVVDLLRAHVWAIAA